MFTNLFAPHHNIMWTEDFGRLSVKFSGTLAHGSDWAINFKCNMKIGQGDATTQLTIVQGQCCHVLEGERNDEENDALLYIQCQRGTFRNTASYEPISVIIFCMSITYELDAVSFKGEPNNFIQEWFIIFLIIPPPSKTRQFWHPSRTWKDLHPLLRTSLRL